MVNKQLKVFALGAISFLLLLHSSILNAQSAFQRMYGSNEFDRGYHAIPTADGGCIIAGRSDAFGLAPHGIYLIKTDAKGDEQWSKIYQRGTYNTPTCIRQTLDKGFIITGTLTTGGSGYEAFFLKTDSLGKLIWFKDFSKSGHDINPNDIRVTPDKGFAVAGNIYDNSTGKSDAFFLKTNSGGFVQNFKTYGNEWNNTASALRITEDNGFIISGSNQDYPGGNGFEGPMLIKTDQYGKMIWTHTYGFLGHTEGQGLDVEIADDGGYVLTGIMIIEDPWVKTGQDLFIIKTDTSGIVDWHYIYQASRHQKFSAITKDLNGNYVLAGDGFFDHLCPLGCTNITLLASIDKKGTMNWARASKTLPIENDREDHVNSIELCKDGGFLISGYAMKAGSASKEDLWMMKTDANGHSCDDHNVDTAFSPVKYNIGIVSSTLAESVFTLSSKTLSNDNSPVPSTDITTICQIVSVKELISSNEGANDILIWPHPVKDIARVEFSGDYCTPCYLTIYDIFGKTVDKRIFSGKQTSLYSNGLSAGSYLLEIRTTNKNYYKKLIIK